MSNMEVEDVNDGSSRDVLGPSDIPEMWHLLQCALREPNLSKEDFRKRFHAGFIMPLLTGTVPPALDIVSVEGSSLAEELLDWMPWAASVKLYLQSSEISPADIGRVRGNIKYPEKLRTLQVDDYVSFKHGVEYVQGITDWAASDESINWDQNLDQPAFWYVLFDDWAFFVDTVEAKELEARQRRLPDAMMIAVFTQSVKDETQYEIHFEEEVALPHPGTFSKLSKRASTAKPDAHVMQRISSVDADPIYMTVMERPSNVHCLKSWQKDMLLGVFPLEEKRFVEGAVVSERQLAMDFLSVQYQRRALALNNRYIYGAAANQAILRLYASTWDSGQVVVAPVAGCSWDLSKPAEFMQCVYFLRALKLEVIDPTFRDDLDSLRVENIAAHLEKINKYLQDNPTDWRDVHSNTSEGQPSASNKRPRSGAGPGDEFDDVDFSDVSNNGDDDENGDLLPSPLQTPSGRLFATALKTLVETSRKMPLYDRWLSTLEPAGYENWDPDTGAVG